MRFKLDENIYTRLAAWLKSKGHDAETVETEGLTGSEDNLIYSTCVQEKRALVTLDLDFSNPLRFPPQATEGVVVLRPRRPTIALITAMLTGLLPSLEMNPLHGRLWIVEPSRIRVYEPDQRNGRESAD